MKTLALASLLFSSLTAPAVAQDVEKIPFQVKHHWIVVKASIGDLEDLSLALDTGSAVSVIQRKIVRKLRLKGKSRAVMSAGRQEKAQEVTLPNLCLGSRCFESVPALSFNLGFTEVDGLIGLDLLRQQSFRLDFATREIHFGPALVAESSIHFPGKLPFLMLRIRTGGKDLLLMLDSGCAETVLFQNPHSEMRVPMVRTGEKIQLEAVGVRSKVERVYLDRISLGETEWNSHLAYVLSTRERPYGGLDGFLSLASLNFQSLSFDFDNNQISWVR